MPEEENFGFGEEGAPHTMGRKTSSSVLVDKNTSEAASQRTAKLSADGSGKLGAYE